MSIRCSFDKKENKFSCYRGKDCIEKLCKKIKETANEIINRERKEIIPLTNEENNIYNEQKIRYICKEKFCLDKDDKNYINRKKVKDHCRNTGKFRGPIHSICSLKYKVHKEIPIIIHNASYDTHFMINQLAIEFKGELNCLGDNMEKYITFSVSIKKEVINNNGDKKQLHTNLNVLIGLDLLQIHYQNLLITHLKFLIVQNGNEKIKINSECYYVGLKNNRLNYKCKKCKVEWKIPLNKLFKKFPSVYQFCNGNLNKFVMLLRKGIYPYEYMDSWEKSNEAALPPKKRFL